MSLIHNPHDKFFKETFGDVGMARSFLKNYLPQEILALVDLETILPQKGSYIDQELQESFSDLLFQVKIHKNEGYLYFLFEHKVRPYADRRKKMSARLADDSVLSKQREMYHAIRKSRKAPLHFAIYPKGKPDGECSMSLLQRSESYRAPIS